jgi:hypothetical protein
MEIEKERETFLFVFRISFYNKIQVNIQKRKCYIIKLSFNFNKISFYLCFDDKIDILV